MLSKIYIYEINFTSKKMYFSSILDKMKFKFIIKSVFHEFDDIQLLR